ncbi:MAG: hypothetical protein P8188_20105 [Gemmatimonadota bacterium]
MIQRVTRVRATKPKKTPKWEKGQETEEDAEVGDGAPVIGLAKGEVVVREDLRLDGGDTGAHSLDRLRVLTPGLRAFQGPSETPDPHHRRQESESPEEAEEAVQEPMRKEGGEGEDDLVLRGDVEPQGAADPVPEGNGQPKEDGRDGQEERYVPRVPHPPGQESGQGVVDDRLLPHRPQDISRSGTPGAVGGAVVAVMAEPDIGVGHQSVLHAPHGPRHLFPWKGVIVRRQGAGGGAGPALEAHLEGISAGAAHDPDELQIRLDEYGLPPVGPGAYVLGALLLRNPGFGRCSDLGSLHRRSSSSYYRELMANLNHHPITFP